MTSKSTKVLHIEDDLDYARLLETAGKEKYDWKHAHNLSDAEEELIKHQYDVIVLDLVLPGTKGEETFQRMMDILSKTMRRPAIVILSGIDDRELRNRLISKGASGFLPKQPDGINRICDEIDDAVVRGIWYSEDTSKIRRINLHTDKKLIKIQEMLNGNTNGANI